MTPLAQQMLKGAIHVKDNVTRHALEDIHCFEVTECDALAWELAKQFALEPGKLESAVDLIFLPAPKTWIERKFMTTRRQAFHLEEKSSGLVMVSIAESSEDGNTAIMAPVFAFKRSTDFNGGFGIAMDLAAEKEGITPIYGSTYHRVICAFLALINTPKIIGRRQVMPHRGLEKKLAKQFGVGKFPLHAWTEIKLHVAKPIEIYDGLPHEAHLTGQRALHFVRKHIRIRLGRLEYVSAHWRGDAAIGIKRSRYLVTN